MKKIILLIIILAFVLPACAGDNSTVDIDGVDFIIPEEYQGGDLSDTSYMKGSGFNFRILSLSSYKNLKFNFGSDSLNDDVLDITERYVGGHAAVVIYSNISSCEHEVITIYFATGDTIYLVCYNGSEVTPEIEKMIENTPASSMSDETFYNKLADAQLEYAYDLEQEEQEIELERAVDNAVEKHQRDHSRFFFYHKSY